MMRGLHKLLPTVMGGAQTADQIYQEAVLGLSPVAYWPLDETSGTTADNAEGTAARDGTYSGVTLNDSTGPFGGAVGAWSSPDYCDIYSASLNSALNFSAISLSVWVKASAAAVWNDTNFKFMFCVRDDTSTNHFVQIYKPNQIGQIKWEADIAGTVSSHFITSVSLTTWFHVVVTFSDANDRMRAYLNGAQSGLDQANAGTPSSPSLVSTKCNIGALNHTGGFNWDGYLAHAAVFDYELSADNVTTLYNGGPV